MTGAKLSSVVRVEPRFQRSALLSRDLNAQTLEGMIGTATALRTFQTMAKLHPTQTAFTWTGSYGTGKSSLSILLAALLGEDAALRRKAQKVLGGQRAQTVSDAFMAGRRPVGRKLISVYGERSSPAESVRKAFASAFPRRARSARCSDDKLIDALLSAANGKDHDGILLVIDEMGKFLEHGAVGSTDVHFFQKLAEAACRSDGALIVIGLLHQSFQMYADHQGEQARQEWSKVQGRFLDIPINVPPEEQTEIFAAAISSQGAAIPTFFAQVVHAVAKQFERQETLADNLVRCWPLHPVTVCLLTQFARSRFAQNQRSVFGFLNSQEPFAFQDFLNNNAGSDTLYTPDLLWDYLKANLESAITASPDNHRWSLVEDSINRARSLDKNGQIEKVMKTIGVIYLLGGVKASQEIIKISLSKSRSLTRSLQALAEKSIIIERKHLGAYYPFEGTDFDLEAAKKEELRRGVALDGHQIARIAGLRRILARRHSIETGTTRYMELSIIAPNENASSVQDAIHELGSHKGRNASLCALLLVDLRNNQTGQLDDLALSNGAPVIIHRPEAVETIADLVSDIGAFEAVRKWPELQGDRVARNEINKRIEFASDKLRILIDEVFKGYSWTHNRKRRQAWDIIDLSVLASDEADKLFHKTPRIRNEILNRTKLSGSANGALKKLMAAMLMDSDKKNLGIEAYPAEKGLYLSILQPSGLHRKKKGKLCISAPSKQDETLKLLDCWSAAIDKLSDSEQRCSVQEIYDLWSCPPYGMNKGPMLLLLWALILANRENISVYVSGVYRPMLDHTDIDIFFLDRPAIELMWVKLDKDTKAYLQALVDEIHWGQEKPTFISPIAISRALVKRVLSLPHWVQRTAQLSDPTRKMRDRLRRASDPNKVIFDDLPVSFKTNAKSKAPLVAAVTKAITELEKAYPRMLKRLEVDMLTSLGARTTPHELPARAMNVGQTGDFRLDAFVQRLIEYSSTDKTSMEGIASLAANKPIEAWVDRDLESARMELGLLVNNFMKAELFAHTNGRKASSMAFGLITAAAGATTANYSEFTVHTDQMATIQKEAKGLISLLQEKFTTTEECLATIAVVGKGLTEKKNA